VPRASKSIIHVHHRGDRGVDGILRLIELASHDGPLETMLTAMCDELAAIAEVDIASIYVREGEDEGALVMRGNHGFPPSAIGTVLGVGEGITGLVAECMRPVSAAHAATEASYKHVPGLGEERFPVFAGIPLISGGGVIGVLVLQRRRKPFATDEVTLATALGAPVTLALCDQRLREQLVAAAGQPTGLRAVAKDYARAPYRVGSEADEERIAEIEELCALIGVAADPRTSARPGAIWLADRIGAFVAIAAVARGASALVASDTVTPAAIAIAHAARLPLVSAMTGVFGWARPGDLLAVDGAAGTVLVHPAPTDIERLRRERADVS
jgi:signal transduction protein with GAF and PtsI domain